MAEFPFEQQELEVTETRTIKRLQVKNLFSEVLQAFNLERGGIYTVKQLFLNPGGLIKGYIGKDRLKYTSPFKLLIITTTVTFILLQYSTSFLQFREGFYLGMKNKEMLTLIENSSRYFNILLWLYLPIGALITWLFNRKSTYNFAENLAFQTYVFSLSNLIMMVVVLDVILSSTFIMLIIYIAFTFYYLYSYKVFFNKGWMRTTIEMTIIYFLSSIVYFFMLLYLAKGYLTLFVN